MQPGRAMDSKDFVFQDEPQEQKNWVKSPPAKRTYPSNHSYSKKTINRTWPAWSSAS